MRRADSLPRAIQMTRLWGFFSVRMQTARQLTHFGIDQECQKER